MFAQLPGHYIARRGTFTCPPSLSTAAYSQHATTCRSPFADRYTPCPAHRIALQHNTHLACVISHTLSSSTASSAVVSETTVLAFFRQSQTGPASARPNTFCQRVLSPARMPNRCACSLSTAAWPSLWSCAATSQQHPPRGQAPLGDAAAAAAVVAAGGPSAGPRR